MKKSILFLVSLLFLIFISVNAKAEILPEGNEGLYYTGGYYPCYYDYEFNYLVGRDRILESDGLMSDLNNVMKETNASVSASWEGMYRRVDGDEIVNFSCSVDLNGSVITKLTYQINSKTVYVLERENNYYVAKTNIPVDLNRCAGTRNQLFEMVYSDNHFNSNLDFSKALHVAGSFDTSVLSLLFGYKVFENDKYLDKSLYFIVDSCNPLTDEDIIKSLNVSDVSCGKISTSNISIIDSDYKIINDYVTPGVYDLTIKAWDFNGNITYQKCKVVSADVTAPTITSVNTLKAKANELLTEEDILSCFNAVDEYSNVTLEIEKDNYSANYQNVGQYTVSVIAKDEAGNEARSSVLIDVEDNTAPTITYNETYITTDSPISMADLKAMITIYDDLDGIITEYDIYDCDDYFGHPYIPGEYEFEIEASDSHENSTTFFISLYVVDKAGPTIEVPTYTLLLNKGEKVTREQILNILKATGQITSMENTVLNSLYFSTLNPEGEYDLEVISDGEVFHDTIRFVDNKKDNIDDGFYNIPIKKEENNNTNYYIILGISAGVIIILSALGVIIYKKKH